MKEINLTQGKIALVDDEDFEYLNQWTWHAEKGRSTFYAKRTDYNSGKAKGVRMHTEILKFHNLHSKTQVDHKNHNGLDNRKENIRPASAGENNMNHNIKQKGSSKYKGVVKHINNNTNSYRAAIQNKNLGFYENEEDAAIAYDNAARELYGEFANLNFPMIKNPLKQRKTKSDTAKTNNRKRGAKNTLGVKGVSKTDNKYLARITKDGQTYQIGRYVTLGEAEKAYKEKEKEFFGESAY